MGFADRIIEKQDRDGMLRRSLERIIQLYTDKSHFIYELLQNAEDANASRIKFVQYEDCLEVMHDGSAFTLSNLQGLCDIGKSDKTKELNQIGEFGVGFKSVFGICESVELYSSPKESELSEDRTAFAVRINDFTKPVDIESNDVPCPYTTFFKFPYVVGLSFSGFTDFATLNKAISRRLKNLGYETLLFLHNLKLIEYEIKIKDNEDSGYYELKKKVINDHCELITACRQEANKSDNDSEATNGYLKFSKPINDISFKRTVDIAFYVTIDKEEKLTFKKAVSPYISVYFPTETESKLDFIVQGPFRTTPNRTSVPAADEENIKLADLLAQLLHESILELRKSNLLNISFLTILPFYKENFEVFSLFSSLNRKVCDLFSRADVIPSKNGEYVTCKEALIARGREIADLFNDKLMTDLIDDGNNYHWLPLVFTENGPYKKILSFFTKELKIKYLRLEDFREYFAKNHYFLQKISDEWLIKFYHRLETITAIYSEKDNRNFLEIPIIKTQKGNFIAAYKKIDGKYIPNVFLPSNENNENDFQIVNQEIYNSCESFFSLLRIKTVNDFNIFIEYLKTNYLKFKELSDEVRLKDLKKILNYLNNKLYSEEIHAVIEELPILKCKINNIDKYIKPFSSEILFPKTENDLFLEDYYKNLPFAICFIDYDFYFSNGISYDNLKKLGVNDSIITGETNTSGSNYKGSGRTSNWSSEGEFRYELTIDKLGEVLKYITQNPKAKDSIVKSQTIFKILKQNSYRLSGMIRIGSGAKLESIKENSLIIRILTLKNYSTWNGKWLYNTEDELVAPNEITKNELNTFYYGNLDSYPIICDLLGFKKSEADTRKEMEKEYESLSESKKNFYFKKALENKYGISINDLDRIINRKDTSIVKESDSYSFGFPIVKVKDWDSLKKHVSQILCYAVPVEYQERIRVIRSSHSPKDVKAYLKNMYRFDNSSNYACQSCHKNTDVIESCQLEKNPKYELEPLYLCLCPTCASRLRNLWVKDDRIREDFIRKIKTKSNEEINKSDYISIKIEKFDIWFTQTHIAEIRELLNLQNDISDENINENYIGKKIFHNDKKIWGTIKSKRGDEGNFCIEFGGKSCIYNLKYCLDNGIMSFEDRKVVIEKNNQKSVVNSPKLVQMTSKTSNFINNQQISKPKFNIPVGRNVIYKRNSYGKIIDYNYTNNTVTIAFTSGPFKNQEKIINLNIESEILNIDYI